MQKSNHKINAYLSGKIYSPFSLAGFVTTALALISVSCLVYCTPQQRYSPHCRLDKTTKDLIWHLLPLSVRLGGKVFRSYMTIVRHSFIRSFVH